MNRNLESHFSVNPVGLDVARSRFDRDSDVKFSGNTGDLIPFHVDEVLPGDTFKITSSKVIRFTTMLKPVMDNLYLDTYWFFVPMRLVWEHTKEFFGENSSSAWAPNVTYTIPQLTFTSSGSDVGSLADYMGACPPGQGPTSVNALPFRAYEKIYDDWFRSEALQAPTTLYTGDSTLAYDATIPYRGGMPRKAGKYFDEFTSCLPQAQRGNAVAFSLASSASINIPSQTMNVVGSTSLHNLTNSLRFGYTGVGSENYNMYHMLSTSPADPQTGVPEIPAGTFFDAVITEQAGGGTITRTEPINKCNLVVKSEAVSNLPITGINPISVNELRLAFQMQKWLEREALFGGRYTSYLKGHFGVTSPDASLQRSEYLGGNRVPISVTQVENNSQSVSTPLGTLGAYSATSDVHEDFIKSFCEHGYLVGLCCVRYKHLYSQGQERMWQRLTVYDHYDPLFANVGNMPVYNKSIYVSGDSDVDNAVFGYQEAWYEYRYKPDRVAGEMRPGITNSLAMWHFADYYTQTPTLSDSWIKEDLAPVDRTLVVTSSTSHQFIADIFVQNEATRVMPVYSVPGLVDHH